MKNFKLAILLGATISLVACGGGGGGSDTPTPTPEPEQPPVAENQAPVCTIGSMNGVDAPADSTYPTLATVDGTFFGQALVLDANCTDDTQIKGLTWEIVEQPERSEIKMARSGYVAGNISDNVVTMWNADTNFVADGVYKISVVATDNDGADSVPAIYTIDYVAANYLSGEYRRDGAFENLSLTDTDRPYYIALPVKAQDIHIGAGVTVISNACNGDELTGGACEIAAVGEFTIFGTEDAPVVFHGGIIRSAETREATLYIEHARFYGGSINHNSSESQYNYFSSMHVHNSYFQDMKGVVLSGVGGDVLDSVFVNVGHEFTNDGQRAAVSILNAEQFTVYNTDFTQAGAYAVGVNSKNTLLGETATSRVIDNTVVDGDIDEAIFDGMDATDESHGNNVQYATTFLAY